MPVSSLPCLFMAKPQAEPPFYTNRYPCDVSETQSQKVLCVFVGCPVPIFSSMYKPFKDFFICLS